MYFTPPCNKRVFSLLGPFSFPRFIQWFIDRFDTLLRVTVCFYRVSNIERDNGTDPNYYNTIISNFVFTIRISLKIF